MVFQELNCTRIGRYSGGEVKEITSKHPIIQFLVNPYYNPPLNLEFDFNQDDVYCAEVPENAEAQAPRITEFNDNKVRILDVGCSSGANLLLLEDLLSRAIEKKVEVKGYDNHKETTEKAKRGMISYDSKKALLHPVVKEIVDKNFELLYKDNEGSPVYVINKSKALPRLQKLLSFEDAKELPEEDNSADATICLYVLRHNKLEDQWKIFRELIRITKPGGYIFTEDFFFRRENKGVSILGPKINPVTSFYDKRKALWYESGVGEFSHESIWPVSSLKEIDKILESLDK